MKTKSYTPAEHKKKEFHCPFCGVYAAQYWGFAAYYRNNSWSKIDGSEFCSCAHCGEKSIWRDGVMVFPDGGNSPLPNADLPKAVNKDYQEARGILEKSPRGAAALLRLAIQKLCQELGEPGKNLNTDIGSLVKKGLPERVRQALDAVRVIGNNAVHPGRNCSPGVTAWL